MEGGMTLVRCQPVAERLRLLSHVVIVMFGPPGSIPESGNKFLRGLEQLGFLEKRPARGR